MRPTITAFVRILGLTSLIFSSSAIASARPAAPIPNPVLYLIGTETYSVGAQQYIRYNYQVLNFEDFPNALFAVASALPPCGANTNAARSWVDFFDQTGKRLYGFCNLKKNGELNTIWFGLPVDQLPPSYVYIEINDRQTNTKYKSNLADTTL